jgi:hypothetical protein
MEQAADGLLQAVHAQYERFTLCQQVKEYSPAMISNVSSVQVKK